MAFSTTISLGMVGCGLGSIIGKVPIPGMASSDTSVAWWWKKEEMNNDVNHLMLPATPLYVDLVNPNNPSLTTISACNIHGYSPSINISTICNIPTSGSVEITSDCISTAKLYVNDKLNITGIPDANGILPKIIGGGSKPFVQSR